MYCIICLSLIKPNGIMSLSQRQRVFTRNVACLIEFAYSIDIELTFGEAHRTSSQGLLNYYGYDVLQDGNGVRLAKRNRTSKTLKSKHLDRLAVDFNFFINGKLTYEKEKLQALGTYWEALHPDNQWGGNWTSFVDTPHFQMS